MAPYNYEFIELVTTDLQTRSLPRVEVAPASGVSNQFLASLDYFSEQVENASANMEMAFVTSIVSASGLSIGVVSWVLRSGALAGSLLAQMPAWKLIDPLIVFGYMRDEEDDESVEDIIEAGHKSSDQDSLPEEELAEDN